MDEFRYSRRILAFPRFKDFFLRERIVSINIDYPLFLLYLRLFNLINVLALKFGQNETTKHFLNFNMI